MRKPSEVDWVKEKEDGYVEVEDELLVQVMKDYAEGERFRASDVARSTGFHRDTIRDRLVNLFENGFLCMEGKGRDQRFWRDPPVEAVAPPAPFLRVGGFAWVPDAWERGIVLAVDGDRVLVCHASRKDGADRPYAPRATDTMHVRRWTCLPSGGVVKPSATTMLPDYVVIEWYRTDTVRDDPPAVADRGSDSVYEREDWALRLALTPVAVRPRE